MSLILRLYLSSEDKLFEFGWERFYSSSNHIGEMVSIWKHAFSTPEAAEATAVAAAVASAVLLTVTSASLAVTSLLLIVATGVGVESASVLVIRLLVVSLLFTESLSVLESLSVVVLVRAGVLVRALRNPTSDMWPQGIVTTRLLPRSREAQEIVMDLPGCSRLRWPENRICCHQKRNPLRSHRPGLHRSLHRRSHRRDLRDNLSPLHLLCQPPWR